MADIGEPDLENVSLHMEMSRGMHEETVVPFDLIEQMEVVDENGQKIKFGKLYEEKKAIIIFLRHFLCFIGKEYAEDFSLIPEAYLKEANVQLVLIGCGPHKFIQSYRDWTNYKGLLYTDPERKLYKSLGLLERMKSGNIKDSKHVKSGLLMGVLKSTWRGMKFCEFQGDTNQQGGSFILGPGNVQHHSHIDQNTTDHVPINDLLGLAKVEQVNYAKDKRVMVI